MPSHNYVKMLVALCLHNYLPCWQNYVVCQDTKSHVNIIVLHVDINHLAGARLKYATIQMSF